MCFTKLVSSARVLRVSWGHIFIRHSVTTKYKIIFQLPSVKAYSRILPSLLMVQPTFPLATVGLGDGNESGLRQGL